MLLVEKMLSFLLSEGGDQFKLYFLNLVWYFCTLAQGNSQFVYIRQMNVA